MGISATASPGPGVNSLIFCQVENSPIHMILMIAIFFIY